MNKLPSTNKILETLDYNPETGCFVWRVAIHGKTVVGSAAGRIEWNGYRAIKIGGVKYRAHRLAFKLVHGRDPDSEIDHINGIRDDNRIANLREATRSQNARNSRRNKNNKSGFKGVCWNARRKLWQATIQLGGTRQLLGFSKSAEAAHELYATAASQHYKEFARIA